MRVGLVGGTFDPIHVGHLLIAETARAHLQLDEMLFIPAGQPWMKEGRPLSPPEHRLNMVRLAIQSNPVFRASCMEIQRPGPTYTVDTLRELHQESGGVDLYYLILGADSVAEFHHWNQPEEVLHFCSLVAAPRPGFPPIGQALLDSIRDIGQKDGNGVEEKLVVLEGPMVDISGAEIRRRVAGGLSVRYQVPQEVERYIHRYGLYQDGELQK